MKHNSPGKFGTTATGGDDTLSCINSLLILWVSWFLLSLVKTKAGRGRKSHCQLELNAHAGDFKDVYKCTLNKHMALGLSYKIRSKDSSCCT